jgi:RNA polymerase sigma-70 factor (sigma-E family)
VEAKMAGLTGEHGGPAGPAASELPAAQGPAGPADPARQAGPAKELAELFRAHHLELVRLAVVMVGDLATAEDVVQDAFERLHSRWRGLRNPASGLAYARSSVLNGCRSVHRHAAVRRRHLTRLGRLPEPGAAADRGLLAAALRRLPPRQRDVLVLRYYCDLDVAEIAATLRIGPGAVRSTMSRGLAALARVLEEE